MINLSLLVLLIANIVGKKLIYVQELFRHGARYPLSTFDTDNSEFASEERLKG